RSRATTRAQRGSAAVAVVATTRFAVVDGTADFAVAAAPFLTAVGASTALLPTAGVPTCVFLAISVTSIICQASRSHCPDNDGPVQGRHSGSCFRIRESWRRRTGSGAAAFTQVL